MFQVSYSGPACQARLHVHVCTSCRTSSQEYSSSVSSARGERRGGWRGTGYRKDCPRERVANRAVIHDVFPSSQGPAALDVSGLSRSHSSPRAVPRCWPAAGNLPPVLLRHCRGRCRPPFGGCLRVSSNLQLRQRERKLHRQCRRRRGGYRDLRRVHRHGCCPDIDPGHVSAVSLEQPEPGTSHWCHRLSVPLHVGKLEITVSDPPPVVRSSRKEFGLAAAARWQRLDSLIALPMIRAARGVWQATRRRQ